MRARPLEYRSRLLISENVGVYKMGGGRLNIDRDFLFQRECGGRGGGAACEQTTDDRGGRKETRWGRTFIRWVLIKAYKNLLIIL